MLDPANINGVPESPPQTPALADPDTLLTLAAKAGFENLTPAERKLLEALPIGDFAVCGPNANNADPGNDPSKGDDWPESRQIRAKLIRWLCVNEAAKKLFDPRGIRIYGAKIADPLDLDYISFPFPIDIRKSRFSNRMSLRGAQIGALYLLGSHLSNPNGPALTADGIKVAGDLFLRDGFSAVGEVNLVGATVGGALDCASGTFSNPKGIALNANRINVAGSVFLYKGFDATGEVNLGSATVGSALVCSGGTFSNPKAKALNANSVNVGGGVFLNDSFKATGNVDLVSATVVSNLECGGGIFSNPNGDALNASDINVAGAVFLNHHFNATGSVNLVGATVGSNLECNGGTFSNPNGGVLNDPNRFALNADRINVAGSAFLNDGFNATGNANLGSSIVGSDLDFSGAIFGSGNSISLDRAKIKGILWWTGINNDPKGSAVVRNHSQVFLNLIDAGAESLIDDENSWPASKNLVLSGFKFERLKKKTVAGTVPRDADSGLRWLRLQDDNLGLPTQPYQQFAKVLESEGNYRGARKVRIAMENDLRASLPWYWQIWRWVLRITISYGYRPWLALCWSLLLVVLGYLTFSLGYRAGVIAPTDKDAFAEFQTGKLPLSYQPFNGFIYSLDTFLPIINLGLKDKWMPDPNLTAGLKSSAAVAGTDPKIETKPLEGSWLGDLVGVYFPTIADRTFFKSGTALRAYLWIHLLLGWVLITLFAAGFTGIIRR